MAITRYSCPVENGADVTENAEGCIILREYWTSAFAQLLYSLEGTFHHEFIITFCNYLFSAHVYACIANAIVFQSLLAQTSQHIVKIKTFQRFFPYMQKN